jgi:hypothetical protein
MATGYSDIVRDRTGSEVGEGNWVNERLGQMTETANTCGGRSLFQFVPIPLNINPPSHKPPFNA